MQNILKFFNPSGEDNVRKLVLDDEVIKNSSGTWYLDDKRKPWAASLSTENPGFLEKQYQFLWQPEEVNLTKDIITFEKLDFHMQETVLTVLSFLQYLDSVVPENDINLSFITGDYEIKQALAMHSFIEGGIHTKSYQYILKTLLKGDKHRIKDSYYKFKTNKELAQRNQVIANNFQPLRDILYKGVLNTEVQKYKEAFFRSVVQDFVIESTVFYTGFLFFHLLADLLPGINQEILLIRRDEELHVSLFNKIIKTAQEEKDMFYSEDMIYEIFQETAEADKRFYISLIQDKLPGLTEKNISSYIENKVNQRLSTLGLKPIYSSVENPFKTIEALNNSSELRKSSFFETGSVEYFSVENISWEDIIRDEVQNIL